MWSELRAVRQQYLGIVALGFAAVPVVGYGIAQWLGHREDFSLYNSGAGRLLITFAIAWWLVAIAHYRQIFTLVIPGEDHGRVEPKVLSRGLAKLHSHYWRWLCAYVVIASLFYAADSGIPAAGAEDWLRCMLIQLIVAILVGVPFYLLALASLGRYAGVAGLEKVHIYVENKLMLFSVLVPLLAGLALMYFYWLRTQLWNEEILLVWSGLGFLVLVSVGLGSRGIIKGIKPLRNIMSQRGSASYTSALVNLRPASTDEFGLLAQSLSRAGRFLEERDSKLHAIIDAVPDGIIITDQTGRINMFNIAAERLFEHRLSSEVGISLCKLMPDLNCENGIPLPIEYPSQITIKIHEDRSLSSIVRIQRMEQGEHNFYFVCLIEEIKTGEEVEQPRLPEQSSNYQGLVESSRDLIWSMDRDGNWTYINNAAKYIYGVDPADLINRSIHQFTEHDYLDREKAAFEALWEGKEWVAFESLHHDREGALHHLHFIATAQKDENNNVVAINTIARDITEQKVYEHKLAYQASHDALTGLFNRNYMRQELERLVARAARGNETGVLMFVDLDQLKFINDMIGHDAGDRLLMEAATLIKKHTRESDLLARYGGDEFTVLLYNVDAEGAGKVAENLRARFGEFKFLEGGNAYSLTCSIGLALIDDATKSADECLAHAERACKNAKTMGRNQVVFYDAVVTKRPTAQDAAWLDRVKGLIEHESYQLMYQPIVSVNTGSVYDYEVLVRLVENEGNMLNPGAFLPTVERLGLSQTLDRCVVEKSIHELSRLREAGKSVRLFINLTSAAMRDETLLSRVRDLLMETNLDASVITFEINETAAVADLVAAGDFTRVIKEMGARLVLEHFGLGFSSFTYLKHLPVDALKIDGSYVQGLMQSVVNQVVVRSINQVAHALGKVTIAPHVENKESFMLLRDLGVDYVQGYYMGRPELVIGPDRYISSALN